MLWVCACVIYMHPLVRSSHNCYRWISEQDGLWFSWLNNSSTTAMTVLIVRAGPHPGFLWVLTMIIKQVWCWMCLAPSLPGFQACPWLLGTHWGTGMAPENTGGLPVLGQDCPPGGEEQGYLKRMAKSRLQGWLKQVFKGTPRWGWMTLTRLIERDRNPTLQHQTIKWRSVSLKCCPPVLLLLENFSKPLLLQHLPWY